MDNETHREKFVRLADARTIEAMRKIAQLSKLANKAAYTYTQADVDNIKAAINAKVEATCNVLTAALEGKKAETSEAFSVVGGGKK